MINKLSAVISCLLIILSVAIVGGSVIGAVSVSAEKDTVGETQSLIDGIVAFKENSANAGNLQEWLDGELTDGAGTTSEWFVITLRQYEKSLDFTAYANALEDFLSQNKIASAISCQRYSLALIACGREGNAFVASTAEDSIGEQGIMSWIFGLHLQNNGVKSNKYTASDIVEKLLSLRLSDGGWALTGEYSDVDVTAMTIQALAPYYSVNKNVRDAVDAALDRLGEKQLNNGGYQSYGAKSPESCAQVLVALSSVGIDAMQDTRFIKNGSTLLEGMLMFRLSDGSFCHTEGGASNNTATTQVFYSLISFLRMQSGFSPLYIFDEGKVPLSELSDANQPPEASETTDPPETSISSETSASAEPDESIGTHYSETSGNSTDISNNQTQGHNNVISDYKIWVFLAIFAAMLIACAILWLCKKRHFKNFIFVLIIGMLAVCIVLVTNFNTTDEYYHPNVSEKSNIVGTVTLTIRCDTIVGKSDSEYIPSDGVILHATEFDLAEGESVFNILVEAARKYNIQMENEGSATGAHGMVYISGINYLYEFDFGELSGWVYHVNGVAPSVGCGDYSLSDGDVIEWLYSCDLGNDVK